MGVGKKVIVSEAGDSRRFVFSYAQLKEDYWRWRSCDDETFTANIVKVLHCAVYISYFKELGSAVLSDTGIIHELVHLLDPETHDARDLPRIRELFNTTCLLA